LIKKSPSSHLMKMQCERPTIFLWCFSASELLFHFTTHCKLFYFLGVHLRAMMTIGHSLKILCMISWQRSINLSGRLLNCCLVCLEDCW
jgi:hypothetical protein